MKQVREETALATMPEAMACGTPDVSETVLYALLP